MNNEKLILKDLSVIMEALLFLIKKPGAPDEGDHYRTTYVIRSALIDAKSDTDTVIESMMAGGSGLLRCDEK